MTEITDNIAPPEEKPKRKPRARKQAEGVKKAFNPAASLLAAFKFVSLAQKKAGPVKSQFSFVGNNWVAATDGVLTIGHKIEEDLNAGINTLQFIEALNKVSDEVAITQLDQFTLAVASGAFRALVPCVGIDEVQLNGPDLACASVDNRIKDAFAAVMGLATEGSPNAIHAGILLQANSAVCTNGSVILEYWHGIDLPPGLLVPKAAAQAIVKSPYDLVSFGFSQASATFHFANGSFIKTQLFAEPYPDYKRVLDVETANYWHVPEDFFKGVRAVEQFSKDGFITFMDGAVLSDRNIEKASTYKIEGLPDKLSYSAKFLLAVEHAFKKVCFNKTNVLFFADNIRGCVAGAVVHEPETTGSFDDFDDDIPF